MAGRPRRRVPKHLAKKLFMIRKRLGVSQQEMARLLKMEVSYTGVSGFERGKREPDLIVLLRYARIGGCTMEQLVDDKIKWP